MYRQDHPISIPLTPTSLTSHLSASHSADSTDAPPPYTVSPCTPNPAHLSRALKDFRENNDPTLWGTRRRSPSQDFEVELPGWLGWIAWFGEFMAAPTPQWAATTGSTPWPAAGGFHGFH